MADKLLQLLVFASCSLRINILWSLFALVFLFYHVESLALEHMSLALTLALVLWPLTLALALGPTSLLTSLVRCELIEVFKILNDGYTIDSDLFFI